MRFSVDRLPDEPGFDMYEKEYAAFQYAAMAAFEGARQWNGTQLYVPAAQWEEAARRAISTYLRRLNDVSK